MNQNTLQFTLRQRFKSADIIAQFSLGQDRVENILIVMQLNMDFNGYGVINLDLYIIKMALPSLAAYRTLM